MEPIGHTLQPISKPSRHGIISSTTIYTSVTDPIDSSLLAVKRTPMETQSRSSSILEIANRCGRASQMALPSPHVPHVEDQQYQGSQSPSPSGQLHAEIEACRKGLLKTFQRQLGKGSQYESIEPGSVYVHSKIKRWRDGKSGQQAFARADFKSTLKQTNITSDGRLDAKD